MTQEPDDTSVPPKVETPAAYVEPSRPPDHSVLLHHRLVAYVWVHPEGGVMRRASTGGDGKTICDVPFAEVRSFDPRAEATMAALVEKSKSAEAFLFKLGMEGFEIVAGATEPSTRIRRF